MATNSDCPEREKITTTPALYYCQGASFVGRKKMTFLSETLDVSFQLSGKDMFLKLCYLKTSSPSPEGWQKFLRLPKNHRTETTD